MSEKCVHAVVLASPPQDCITQQIFIFFSPHVLEMHCVTLVFSYIYIIN